MGKKKAGVGFWVGFLILVYFLIGFTSMIFTPNIVFAGSDTLMQIIWRIILWPKYLFGFV